MKSRGDSFIDKDEAEVNVHFNYTIRLDAMRQCELWNIKNIVSISEFLC